jgi:hypothetical protein
MPLPLPWAKFFVWYLASQTFLAVAQLARGLNGGPGQGSAGNVLELTTLTQCHFLHCLDSAINRREFKTADAAYGALAFTSQRITHAGYGYVNAAASPYGARLSDSYKVTQALHPVNGVAGTRG